MRSNITHVGILSLLFLLALLFSFSVYLLLGSSDRPLPVLKPASLISLLEQPILLHQPSPESHSLYKKLQEYSHKNPQDGYAWVLYARTSLQEGKLPQAIHAYKEALKRLGPAPTLMADFGEALFWMNNGVMTDVSKTQFERALRQNPNLTKARFFLELAQLQENTQTQKQWEMFLKTLPADSPWHKQAKKLQKMSSIK